MSKDITRVMVPPPIPTDAPSTCTQTDQDVVRGKRLKDIDKPSPSAIKPGPCHYTVKPDQEQPYERRRHC